MAWWSWERTAAKVLGGGGVCVCGGGYEGLSPHWPPCLVLILLLLAAGAAAERGKAMSLLPLDPSLSRALLAAKELGCLDEVGGVRVGGEGLPG